MTKHNVAAVNVRNVTRQFGQQKVLNGVDLAIRQGEFIALLGRSGSGKTTLLRVLGGLDQIDGGEVVVPEKRSTVFQEPRLMPWKTAWRNVVLGVRGDKKQVKQKALAALAEVGLSHRIDAYPSTLSGGEAQRVALARSLVREPELLLLDEPFAALDALTRIKAHQLIQTLWQTHGPAVLIVTHDVDEAVLLADRVLVLADGRISKEITIGLPRPRTAASNTFQEIRRELLHELGVEEPTGNQYHENRDEQQQYYKNNRQVFRKAASA
ncbi:ABC transporter ATP-binding protein [Chromatiaceae bacterium AAb-1]|nr:ABC transporter ATP-binding protein [Chromatiaceae bacterium AAb-1]